jgi:hypothetical protein
VYLHKTVQRKPAVTWTKITFSSPKAPPWDEFFLFAQLHFLYVCDVILGLARFAAEYNGLQVPAVCFMLKPATVTVRKLEGYSSECSERRLSVSSPAAVSWK